MLVPELVESLAIELRSAVDEIVELTESLESIQSELEGKKTSVRRLKVALDALTGSDIPIGVDTGLGQAKSTELPPPSSGPSLPQRVAPTGPVCGACGGEMFYQARTLNSGRVVNLWTCSDCKNERP